MRRQIQQMEDAGFDFVILNLPADHPMVMETVNVFFQQLHSHNLRAAVQVDALYDATPEVKRQWAADVINRWGSQPEYLRLNGQPVVYLYAASIDFNLPNVEVHNVYWTRDYTQGRNTYNPFGVLPPEDWPFWAASPVPVINGVAPIIPGYSDTHLNRSFSMEHPREGSRLYREQWEQAVGQHPEYIVVYSWNEYFEETAIEPTTAWGDEFVRITRCFSDKIRNHTNANCS